MLFDKIFILLGYYLAFLSFITLLGAKFAQKHNELNAIQPNAPQKKSALKGLYKHCPCRTAVENGTMSSICIYSSVAGFMLSLTNIALMGNYATQNFIVLVLSIFCAWLGWVLKK